jgi:Rad3-related DNA helicase
VAFQPLRVAFEKYQLHKGFHPSSGCAAFQPCGEQKESPVENKVSILQASYGNNQAAQDYMRAVALRMRQLVSASRGRAFLLFASKRMLDQVYGEISTHIPYPLLRQGDLPRAELV